jgi:hypothetical protein
VNARRALSNRFLRHATHVHATDQKVEWCVSFPPFSPSRNKLPRGFRPPSHGREGVWSLRMELHVLNQPFPRPQALRVRHPRQLVLPLLPPTVRRPTVARPRRDEVQLGLPLGRQHALPLRSECPPFLLSSLAVPSFQFSFSARSFPPRRLLGMEAGEPPSAGTLPPSANRINSCSCPKKSLADPTLRSSSSRNTPT